MIDWDRRFMALAEHVAMWSKDRSTQVGAVIVGPDKEIVSLGYNGFARGINDEIDERHERPIKYKYVCHAELNAVLNATRTGAKVWGCYLYVSSLPPCSQCANAIVQAGIMKVYCRPIDKGSEAATRWLEDIEVAEAILEEGGVELIYIGRDE